MNEKPGPLTNDVAIEIRRNVARLGPNFSPSVLRATRDIYRPHIPASAGTGVAMHKDVAYGPSQRHRLDAYRPVGTGLPVIVFVHGGGFVAGSKDEDGTFHRNVGEYFASHGYLTLVANYRLAPADPWPAGAQDVGRMVDWASAHAPAHGGDPARLMLVGQSAGASHVASWLFDRSVRGNAPTRIAAAVLMSGFFRAEAPLPEAIRGYFGEDTERYAARSPIGHVEAGHPPLLLTVTEFDPGAIAKHTFDLARALSSCDGCSPRFAWFAGHNHVSTVQSLGSPQDDVGAVLRDFLCGVPGR